MNPVYERLGLYIAQLSVEKALLEAEVMQLRAELEDATNTEPDKKGTV